MGGQKTKNERSFQLWSISAHDRPIRLKTSNIFLNQFDTNDHPEPDSQVEPRPFTFARPSNFIPLDGLVWTWLAIYIEMVLFLS